MSFFSECYAMTGEWVRTSNAMVMGQKCVCLRRFGLMEFNRLYLIGGYEKIQLRYIQWIPISRDAEMNKN